MIKDQVNRKSIDYERIQHNIKEIQEEYARNESRTRGQFEAERAEMSRVIREYEEKVVLMTTEIQRLNFVKTI